MAGIPLDVVAVIEVEALQTAGEAETHAQIPKEVCSEHKGLQV